MAGLSPKNADDVNYQIGTHLRQFVDVQEIISHDWNSLQTLDLTAPPFNMDQADETTIKTAVNQLDQALQAVDMTFINRLTGLF